ncbi:transcription factor MAMYB [Dendrobium catenatum]|uniref:Transcription factor DIVARICATA n=1 Tax=Dendrobium catenatum TaxID=906689 RepID=A0A2I0WS77_9ASPA|nr:transcription factor MAMYB [Dendrobium catenatum]PKU78525.1 Transcription factor DIVARICATA [Dendrobium catenatum]
MEFIDEDARPRFLFQARSSHSSSSLPETPKISKLHAASCISAAALLIISALLLSSSTSILSTFLIWISLSLLVAPFAPPSTTGGDPRVGRGDPLPSPLPKPTEPEEPRRRPASRWNPKPTVPSSSPGVVLNPKPDEKRGVDPASHDGESVTKEANQEDEWSVEDLEVLKRQISKHPAGAPGRWDRVAEAFKGQHGVESVIRAAKSLAERRPPGNDSFAQFLKQRKPLDKRVDVNVDLSVNGSDGDTVVGNVGWSSGEDIALLNALKAFPKDAPMRWEKVAAAVPGKSKTECMRRVSELKRDFRSSKTSES